MGPQLNLSLAHKPNATQSSNLEQILKRSKPRPSLSAPTWAKRQPKSMSVVHRWSTATRDSRSNKTSMSISSPKPNPHFMIHWSTCIRESDLEVQARRWRHCEAARRWARSPERTTIEPSLGGVKVPWCHLGVNRWFWNLTKLTAKLELPKPDNPVLSKS
jgi:hypothetical protein